METDKVLAALPPPAAWAELAKAIAARPAAKGRGEIMETGLRFLAAALTGDTEAPRRETTNLQAKAKDATASSAYFYRSLLQDLNQTLLTLSDDPEAVLNSLQRQLDSARGGRTQNIRIPNLVAGVGPDKAETFLRKALVQPNVQLQFEGANETARMARKLALELIDQLKTPQWSLVNSLNSVELYEALDKHFGAETNSVGLPPVLPGEPDLDLPMDNFGNNPKNQARLYYLLGLIAKDRSKDAVAIAQSLGKGGLGYLSDQAFEAMEHAGYTAALDNFFYELLSQDPTLSFWEEYVPLAAKAGKTERMLALARSTVGRDDLSDAKKAAIREILFKALLAADAVDEGVQEIRRLIALDDPSTSRSRRSDNQGQLGVMLAQIGVLLQKPEWTEEGLGVAKGWLSKSGNQSKSSWESGSVVTSISEILFKLNRGPEAEAVLADALARTIRADSARGPDDWDTSSSSQQYLACLAALYHRAGRAADVLVLLDQSPNWGMKDLGELTESCGDFSEASLMSLHNASSTLPVMYLAANALLSAGRSEQAGKIIDELLNRQPGLDRGYELLLTLKGTNAIPILDQLFTRDQFEERPLIWKAHLLRQQNQLAEAEKVVRRAIAIDPSDGEEGRGDRMRAYAELAEIRDALGDKKEGDFYREIIKAIRLSEDADQFYMAGLLKRAIAMYEEGLTHFADAYCIQSRLAIQLAALGQNQAAEEHYRRAYELMPDSFGLVESHCFGCERVFNGAQPQSIADQVFTKLVAERPDKPQVHYLLGYLREEQERYEEARTNYYAATKLDSGYLNAWSRLQGISGHLRMTAKERDEIVFNLVRLDPLQRHASTSFERVSDLVALWNIVDAAARRLPVPALDLYPLAASKTALENKEAAMPPGSRRNSFQQEMLSMRETGLGSPGRAVAQTPFVRLAGQMIFGGNNMAEE